MVAEKLNRYPGVRPFNKDERIIYFGREQEAKKLFTLLMMEKIVVLFGKGGKGKSSLINAGLIPMLHDKKVNGEPEYIPVEIIFGKVTSDSLTPVQKLLARLKETLRIDTDINTVYDKYPYKFKLWPELKKMQLKTNRKFIFLFDQFEEFFSYPTELQDEFKWELAEILFTKVPQVIRENIDDLTGAEYEQISKMLDVRVLFSIKSDSLSLMHCMADALPTILQNRFEIMGLSEELAREAIIKPALLTGDQFKTHPFSYDEESMQTILGELSKVKTNGVPNIETFQLQIICQACESAIETKMNNQEIDTLVNKADLPNFETLYDDYYERQLNKLSQSQKVIAQSLMENEFIIGSPQTGGYRRVSVDKNVLIQSLEQNNVDEKILDELESVFLVRKEPNTVGSYSYELAHDTMLAPIMKISERRNRSRDVELGIRRFKKRLIKNQLIIASVVIALLTVALLYVSRHQVIIGLTTFFHNSKTPSLLYNTKLDQLIARTENNLVHDFRGKLENYGAWSGAQILAAMFDKPQRNNMQQAMLNEFRNTLTKTIDPIRYTWNNEEDNPDMRMTTWIVSSQNLLDPRGANQKSVDYLLGLQYDDGSWPLIEISDVSNKYSSTFTTCHALRALFNALPHAANDSMKQQIRHAIKMGADWLKRDSGNTKMAIWTDYDQTENVQTLVSKSLSGLTIHTLNLIGESTPEINRAWLDGLDLVDASAYMAYRERSDQNFEDKYGDLVYNDGTRHLVQPWQIIAIRDAFRDGNLRQRYRANKWLNNALRNANPQLIAKEPPYIQSEILIALKHLRGKDYVFK